jgi:hypothetical protein
MHIGLHLVFFGKTGVTGDRELEGMRKDTRHKIYTGSGCQGGEPFVLFGGTSMAPCAWCWLKSGARLGTRPSFIGGGFLVGYKAGVLVALHGTSPSRIAGEF